MSTVVNKVTFQVIKLANTPDFLDGNWLINPTIPACVSKYWKLVGETIEEMTQIEKDEVEYSIGSIIYLISEKRLLLDKNGHDYTANPDAIINPVMPGCELKYTKAVAGKVVEMTVAEKAVVDLPGKLQKWERDVAMEIRTSYSLEEEMSFLRQLTLGKATKDDPEILAWGTAITAAKEKYPKPA